MSQFILSLVGEVVHNMQHTIKSKALYFLLQTVINTRVLVSGVRMHIETIKKESMCVLSLLSLGKCLKLFLACKISISFVIFVFL